MFLPLVHEAEKLTKSSGYRYGDLTSFSVYIAEGVDLPGLSSPADYLDHLGLKSLPVRVLVVGPGNGGLVAECLHRGAKEVIALESRDRFRGTLVQVLALLAKGLQVEQKTGLIFRIYPNFPTTTDQQRSLGKFDLILWPDGCEEITEPRAVFSGLSACLAQDAKFYVEIWHGRDGWADRVNSWHPTTDAMLVAVTSCFGQSWLNIIAGRNDTRRIYVLANKVAKEEPNEPPKVVPKAPPPPPLAPIKMESPKNSEEPMRESRPFPPPPPKPESKRPKIKSGERLSERTDEL